MHWTSRRTTAVAVLAAACLASPQLARAFSCRPGLLPNGNVNRCLNCHLSEAGGGARNPFGELIASLNLRGCEEFWGPDVASEDSDGDGFTNGQELGDPLGLWMDGDPDPGDPDSVSLPGDATSVPDLAPRFVRGDANADGTVDISDAVFTLLSQFAGAEPVCRDALDSDDNGLIEITDPVFLLEYLFVDGPVVPAPGALRCGPDPTEDSPELPGGDLGCEAYPPDACTN